MFQKRMVALHSNDRYHWKCTVCGHRWATSPNNRSRGTSYPACKHCCVDPDVNSLAVVNKKLAGEFDLALNYPLTSRDIAGYDNRDYWWTCDEGHSCKPVLPIGIRVLGVHTAQRNKRFPV